MREDPKRRLSTRRHFVVVASGAALGCAASCSFRRPYDGQAVDLRGFNLFDEDEIPDLSGEPEPELDLSVDDLRPPPDMRSTDLRNADLRPPPDLYTPDLRPPPPDLRQPADLSMPPPDMRCSGTFTATGAKNLGLQQVRFYPTEQTIIARDARGFMAIWYRCRHAGCPVNWNAGALTYDCPCHGSRFRIDGSLLMGPATQNMLHRVACRDSNNEIVVDLNDAFYPDINQRI